MDMEFDEKQNDVLNLHIRFINLVLRNGRSITRWRQGNNICIPKLPGCIDINKFRNTYLNAIIAIKWRSATQKAEDKMKLCESQFGSQKTRTIQFLVPDKYQGTAPISGLYFLEHYFKPLTTKPIEQSIK
jgi:hypothetical protein